MGGGELLDYIQTELRTLVTCSALGGAFSFLVGGVDLPISSLLMLICIDYATGIYAGWVNHVLSSQISFNGLKRKIFILVMVALANLLDNAMGLNHMFRTMMVFGYATMEGISIFENFDRIGWGQYIPAILRSKLIQLRDERGLNNENSN